LGRWESVVSSSLLCIEGVRACARYGERYAAQALAGLSRLALLPIDDLVVKQAAKLPPPSLRSLDAIHLATALSLGDDLGVLIAYDERLIEAARENGITVISPGRSVRN
jgi:predicted nucleic acid-binding protein